MWISIHLVLHILVLTFMDNFASLNRNTSVRIVTGYRMNDRCSDTGRDGILLVTKQVYGPTLGSIHPPIYGY
jgi:hypothetical protein